MRINPFYDSWLFLSGETGSHQGVGGWRFGLVALFWTLALSSVAIAYRNWNTDPSQRTAVHVGTLLCRLATGAMWFEGALWKLPIPSGGFQYWLQQEAEHAAFSMHKDLITSIILPNLTAVNVCVFLAEIGMAASMILGFGVRLFSVTGMLFAAQLYFGLYTHPNEWPWEFIFIIVIHAQFLLHAAGRSLGLDALLRRQRSVALDNGPLAKLYRLAS